MSIFKCFVILWSVCRMSLWRRRWLYHQLLLQTAASYTRLCTFGWRCWPCANVCPGHRPRHRQPAIGVWLNSRWRLANCPSRYRRRLTPYNRGSSRLRTTINSWNCRPETAWVRDITTTRGPDQRYQLFKKTMTVIITLSPHRYYCFAENFVTIHTFTYLMITVSSAGTGTEPKLAGSLQILIIRIGYPHIIYVI